MPIVNDLLTGSRGGGPRVFLHLNWHAAEICMPYEHILRFHDLPTSVERSLGSNKKLIPSMPRVPKSPACRACQILSLVGHVKISLWRALNAQVSSLHLQLSVTKKKWNVTDMQENI